MRKIFFSVLMCAALVVGCKSRDQIVLEGCGLTIPLAVTYLQNGVSYEALGKDETHIPAVLFLYTDQANLSALAEEVRGYSQKEYFDRLDEIQARAGQYRKVLELVLVIPDDEYDEYMSQNTAPDFAPVAESGVLGHKGGNTYWYVRYDDTADGLDVAAAADFAASKEAVAHAVSLARFTAIRQRQTSSAQENAYPTAVPSFTTTDLDGKNVTEAIFSHADITVLNVWGTFCGPCIGEMPELGAWAKDLPDTVQLVGLVSDVRSSDDTDGIAEAKGILADADAHFTNLVAGNDFSAFLQSVQFVPTTFLVDRNGAIIGEPIVGARVFAYKAAVESYLAK